MTQVNPKDFANTVYGSFRTYWTALHPTVPVSYPNREFDPAEAGVGDTSAWVRLYSLGDADGGNVRYSSSAHPALFGRSGILTIEVHARIGQGMDRAYDLAIDVLAWMEKPAMANVFLTGITGPTETGPDGTWFQVVHSARWRYFTDRPD